MEMVYAFGSGVLIFVMAVIVHWVVLQIIGIKNYLMNAFTVLSVVLLVVVLFYIASSFFFFVNFLGLLRPLWPLGPYQMLISGLVIIILWNSYIIFFVNLKYSVSFKIMSFLLENSRSSSNSNSKSNINIDTLKQRFSDNDLLETRLLNMMESGLLFASDENGGETLVLTNKGKVVGAIHHWLRRFLSIKTFG